MYAHMCVYCVCVYVCVCTMMLYYMCMNTCVYILYFCIVCVYILVTIESSWICIHILYIVCVCMCVCVCVCVYVHDGLVLWVHTGWLRSVGSIKLQVSFAE